MADYSQIENAHKCGLSVGKYMAYLELEALDSSITPEDISGMTMREIRDILNSYSSQNTYYQSDYCNESHQGHKNGHHGNR